MAKIKRKCSKCRRSGHNSATCKNKKKKTTKKKARKKKTIRKSTKKKTKKTKKKKTKKKATVKSGKRRPATNKAWNALKKRKVLRFVGTTTKGNLSAKDWGIGMTSDGFGVATWWGKIWGAKTLKPKRFSTKAAATAYYNKKVSEKRRKGYQGGRKKRRKKRRKHRARRR